MKLVVCLNVAKCNSLFEFSFTVNFSWEVPGRNTSNRNLTNLLVVRMRAEGLEVMRGAVGLRNPPL